MRKKEGRRVKRSLYGWRQAREMESLTVYPAGPCCRLLSASGVDAALAGRGALRDRAGVVRGSLSSVVDHTLLLSQHRRWFCISNQKLAEVYICL